jgi:hypothetical protein
MDEFADLEIELGSDQINIESESIKSLVQAIEHNELEPTMFFNDRNANWDVTKRISFIALGILTLPLLGLGLVFIYLAFDNGPFFEKCIIVEAKVYLAEQSLVLDYRMADDEIMKLNCMQVTNRSHIKHHAKAQHTSDYDTYYLNYYSLVTGEHEMELLMYSDRDSLEEGVRIKKLISKFANIANLKISS